MLQLGIVTYNIAKDWTLDQIFSRLEALAIPGVELRTGHAHGVEVTLGKPERDAIRKRFEDSPVELAGLGSAFEYQSNDPAKLRENIDGTKAYVRLAHDIGSPGVKVRPNGIVAGVDPERTYEQIGRALHEVGKDAADFGVEIRVEVHGGTTQLLPNFAKIIQHTDHPNVGTCWNSNPTDVVNGSIAAGFDFRRPDDPRGPPPRPDRRGLPLARPLCPPRPCRLHRLHPRRDRRVQRPQARPPLLPEPLGRLSARGGSKELRDG